MNVFNVHECELDADAAQIGTLIDSLASRNDQLWPKHIWPPMKFDRPLGIGAKGGHGPIRYVVEAYTTGVLIQFRFTGPKGFDGFHTFEIVQTPDRKSALRHTLKMKTHGSAVLSWPLLFEPMHDALIEDSFTTAQISLGLTPESHPWPLRVKILRWMITRGKTRPQSVSNKTPKA